MPKRVLQMFVVETTLLHREKIIVHFQSHTLKVTQITLSYNVAKTAMERSKGVSTQQTLQCQCIGGLQKYLKGDV